MNYYKNILNKINQEYIKLQQSDNKTKTIKEIKQRIVPIMGASNIEPIKQELYTTIYRYFNSNPDAVRCPVSEYINVLNKTRNTKSYGIYILAFQDNAITRWQNKSHEWFEYTNVDYSIFDGKLF